MEYTKILEYSREYDKICLNVIVYASCHILADIQQIHSC